MSRDCAIGHICMVNGYTQRKCLCSEIGFVSKQIFPSSEKSHCKTEFQELPLSLGWSNKTAVTMTFSQGGCSADDVLPAAICEHFLKPNYGVKVDLYGRESHDGLKFGSKVVSIPLDCTSYMVRNIQMHTRQKYSLKTLQHYHISSNRPPKSPWLNGTFVKKWIPQGPGGRGSIRKIENFAIYLLINILLVSSLFPIEYKKRFSYLDRSTSISVSQAS